jgi:hypothetical protein
LAHIPTEESAKVVLDMLAGTDVLEEWHVRALHDIGSASAIDPLIEYCDPEWVPCARALLLLCEVNGVDRPEMGEWRRTIEESERLMEERLARLQKILGEGRPRPPASHPGTGHRKLSVKSEKRKRAKARIANLQRKKKRK